MHSPLSFFSLSLICMRPGSLESRWAWLSTSHRVLVSQWPATSSPLLSLMYVCMRLLTSLSSLLSLLLTGDIYLHISNVHVLYIHTWLWYTHYTIAKPIILARNMRITGTCSKYCIIQLLNTT